MKTSFTGGCYCGAVRYECTASADQIQMFRCHCRDCQRVMGGPYAAVMVVPKETFRVTQGSVQHHTTQSEAMGGHVRGFCAACGSRLTGGEGEPGKETPIIGMTAASLDDPSWFKPAMDIFVADAQPWDSALAEPTEKFDRYAPF